MFFTLTNHRYTAKVDSLGAQLVSLRDQNGFEYLWTGDEAYWRGQAPVLFPMVGALRDGRALIGGKPCEMGQHGFARRREFSLSEQTEESVSLTLRDDEETWTMYPFAFRFTVTYTLKEEGIETAFLVENTGSETLPFAVGGHPGFNIPVGEDASFEDYTISFEKEEEQSCPAIVMGKGLIDPSACAFELKGREIPLAHRLFYNDALVFEHLNSRRVQIVNKKSGHGVEMEFSQFPMFGIWSAKNDGPYVCLEPWTGCATRTDEGDVFEQKRGMTLLPAGEKKSCAFSVRIL